MRQHLCIYHDLRGMISLGGFTGFKLGQLSAYELALRIEWGRLLSNCVGGASAWDRKFQNGQRRYKMRARWTGWLRIAIGVRQKTQEAPNCDSGAQK